MVRGTGFYNFASFFLSACVKKSCPFLHLSNALSCSGSATKTIITKSEQRICYLEISVQERYFKKVIFKKRSVRDIYLLKSLFNPEFWNLKCNSLFFQRPNCFQNIVFFYPTCSIGISHLHVTFTCFSIFCLPRDASRSRVHSSKIFYRGTCIFQAKTLWTCDFCHK